jgi:Ni/Co efflux regulator RcnB
MRIVVAAALVLSVGFASSALADKGGNPNKGKGQDKDWQARPGKGPGGPPGHAKKFGANDNAAIQAYYGQSFRGNCPPGLAKKNNGCLPPGHAKRWNIGQALPAGITWYAVPQDLYVRLTPPPTGHRYVYLDGGVLLLNVSTRLVIDAVSINIAIR